MDSGCVAEAFVRAIGYRAQTIDGAPIEHAPADALVSVVLLPNP